MEEQKLIDAAKIARRNYSKQYYQKNRDKLLATQREYRKTNPEKVKETQDRYWQKKALQQLGN